MILGTKFHLIVVKSHLNASWIIFKFPISNTLPWRTTELQGINVTAPSGYLCDTGMKSKEVAEAETHTQTLGKNNLAWQVEAHLWAGQVIPSKSTNFVPEVG